MGSGTLLRNAGGDGIITYCIFDSDFHPEEVIRGRYAEAKTRRISLHIWQQKELENYVLVPGAIRRAICAQLPGGAVGPTLEVIESKLEEIAEGFKQDVIDCLATHIQNADRKLSAATVNQRARKVLAERWNTARQRLGVIPGKEALSRISGWAQKEYRVSISPLLIAHHMLPSELPSEMRDVLTAFEDCESFPQPTLGVSPNRT